MRLLYVQNASVSGSPYNQSKGWKGWSIELHDGSRIQVSCEQPDETIVGCLVKGALEIDIEQPLLEYESVQINHHKFPQYEVWSFILNESEMKTVFCAMLDWIFNESGVSDVEFREYAEMYRSK